MPHHKSVRHPEATISMARALGWFSIGLGLAEILTPRQVGNLVGMDDKDRLVRLYGGREIAQGLGLLLARDPAPWAWARVAGDALDIATVAAASRGRPGNVGGALAVLTAVTLLDLYCARRLTPMPVSDPARLEEYRGRSGFPRSPGEMRGSAANGSGATNGSGAGTPDRAPPAGLP